MPCLARRTLSLAAALLALAACEGKPPPTPSRATCVVGQSPLDQCVLR